MARLEGMRLGSCQIRQRIGGGGMGEVYLADQKTLGRQVAVKVIHEVDVQAMDADALTRQFQREARAIAMLEHAHILPIYEYGEQDNLYYFVTLYVPEGSLSQQISDSAQIHLSLPLAPQLVKQIIGQAADALQFAHDRGIIHRDVKPANLLVRWLPPLAGTDMSQRRPHVLLADFGLARFLSEMSSRTGASGTPLYSPPEQFQGHPIPATDQYALACTAYLLLTGKPPFSGDVIEVYHQQFSLMPPAPTIINPRLPQAADAVLLRALAKQPEQRYPRIADFAAALQIALATVQSAPASTAYQPAPVQLIGPWPAWSADSGKTLRASGNTPEPASPASAGTPIAPIVPVVPGAQRSSAPPPSYQPNQANRAMQPHRHDVAADGRPVPLVGVPVTDGDGRPAPMPGRVGGLLHRGGWRVAVAVLLVVVLASLLGLATYGRSFLSFGAPGPTASTTKTATSGISLPSLFAATPHVNSALKFSVRYPSAWRWMLLNSINTSSFDQTHTTQDSVYGPTQSFTVTVSQAFDELTNQEILAYIGLDIPSETTPTSSFIGIGMYNHVSCLQQRYESVAATPQMIYLRTACQYDGVGYDIVMQSPATSFDSDYTTYYGPMFDSFRFIG